MTIVTMYTTQHCPFCRRAEALLAARGVKHIEQIDVDRSDQALSEMISRTGRRTVPQIFIGARHIGGCDDLIDADRRGELVHWLAQSPG